MDNNNLPNFLIVGAAKAGTTSLHNYIDKHPHVLMSSPKEPKYFSYRAVAEKFTGPGDQMVLSKIIKNHQAYERLFQESGQGERKMYGESSADNLYYHNEVVPVLKKELETVKIIIILRNPVERAFSAYTHLLRDQREDLSFEEALRAEEKRIKEGYEFIWHYRKVGLYYEQVLTYLENFKDVKIFLFEDLKNNSEKIFSDMCDFLGLNKVEFDSSDIYNPSGLPTNTIKTSLYRAFRKNSYFKKLVKNFIPRSSQILIRDKVKHELFNKHLIKPRMTSETREELIEFYRNDILKLQNLIHRDLTNWFY